MFAERYPSSLISFLHLCLITSLVVGLAVTALLPRTALSQSPSDDLELGPYGAVRALAVQPDGKLLVGGYFATLGGEPRDQIGRLNADGTVDADFNPGAEGTVVALAVQPDGKIVVGGRFTTLDGTPRDNIGVLNPDGSLDPTFITQTDDAVWSLATQADGKLLVAGFFTTLGGEARSYVGRLNADGTVDADFDPEVSSAVFTLALQPDGKILMGGYFTTVEGERRDRIARLNPDGSLDTSFSPRVNGPVVTLAVQPDGKILVGGLFTTLGGEPRSNLGRLNADGTLDTGFDPGANGSVRTLALQADGALLVGGHFTMLSGEERERLARLNPDGTLDAGFDSGADDTVLALALQEDGSLMVGGRFSTLDAHELPYLGRRSGDTAATQALTVAANGASLTWTRSGSSPEVWLTTFEQSTDGDTYTPLGTGTRIPGGWQLSGLALPVEQDIFIRAHGIYGTGQSNGSVSRLESVQEVYLTGQPPAFTSASGTSFAVDATGVFTVSVTGAPVPTLALSGSLPSGIAFSVLGEGMATLSGTPAAGTSGVYTLTFTAANGIAPDAVQVFTLTVNESPAFTSAESAAFLVGRADTFTVTTTGFPAPLIAVSGTLPAGVSFTGHADGTATLAGTPGPGSGGIYALTLTAANGVEPDAVQAFTLLVGTHIYLPLVQR